MDGQRERCQFTGRSTYPRKAAVNKPDEMAGGMKIVRDTRVGGVVDGEECCLRLEQGLY